MGEASSRRSLASAAPRNQTARPQRWVPFTCLERQAFAAVMSFVRSLHASARSRYTIRLLPPSRNARGASSVTPLASEAPALI